MLLQPKKEHFFWVFITISPHKHTMNIGLRVKPYSLCGESEN